MKRMLAASLATVLVMHPAIIMSASSIDEGVTSTVSSEGVIEQKDEVVYANLRADGVAEELYIVNALHLESQGKVTDYGAYDEVINLTDTSAIQQSANETIQIEATEETFYYQGNLKQDVALPWEFEISYSLNGQPIDGQSLIGESGDVEIQIDVKQNKDVEPEFFENYMMQITVPFSNAQFSDIQAEGATIANAGQDKQVVFTVMPETEETVTVQASTSQFELEGIQMSGMPSSVAIDPPDTEELTGEFESLTGALVQLNDGLGDVHAGLVEFTDGLHQLESGSSEYASGIQETANAGSELRTASSEINEGLQALQNGLSGQSDLEIDIDGNMFGALEELADGLSEINGALSTVRTGYDGMNDALNAAVQSIPDEAILEEELGQLMQENPDSQALGQLVQFYEGAQRVKGTYAEIEAGLSSTSQALQELEGSVEDVESGLRQFAKAASSELGNIDVGDGLQSLTGGIDQLANQYGMFHEGLRDYTSGVEQLSSAYGEVDSGIAESSSGANELAAGTESLSNGMTELTNATEEIPEQMQEEIDEMISQYDKSDYEAISFSSEQNNEYINSVQFVVHTESLHMPDDEQEEDIEEEPSMWQRFLQLFGL
ncbi:YhgE/Pip domain-containing protein [Geomicrobium sediminis]|uniref:X-X-X-Leu-X-X-Gly heptad repeat protein n=1 Tax=Geomicrobium sediminis TaxID=1347788 RepID=A0ABS2PCI6_9BACL|nr:YhgE/Pip domain-containing protein [Geomicrobium sediminis]MBM7633029.1 X-X-X-Leu-X-X-Gly heptad repeat protein [Geomicrobium sediminis]